MLRYTGILVYRTASTVPQYTDISVYRYTPNATSTHPPSSNISVQLSITQINCSTIDLPDIGPNCLSLNSLFDCEAHRAIVTSIFLISFHIEG